ncbi:hypothetical protein [Photobacterium alginatilyticum]|uniref:Uncharacterized protein n=1 Tax=Photobacterium alginatilyticum TaxID=1775171 RepID=A0ABW9YJR8_9GAMM|nr:hypothetical protein [Photobacterium alginatilyticum]NBI54031.1 hypothetical protein [Photobacterium alginatilyticum]
MEKKARLYSLFFKAEERFLNHPVIPGFEPDIIIEFVQSGLNLASYYCRHSPNYNPLLQELFLRRVFFHLTDAIAHRGHSRIFRRICLDHLHCPLLALKKHYGQSDEGKRQLHSLQRNLLQLHHTSGF